jgi:TP53 regulating kinase-like protein
MSHPSSSLSPDEEGKTALPTGSSAAPSSLQPAPARDVFVAPDDWPLLSQGAEARLWKIPPGDEHPAQRSQVSGVAKERFAKAYRHPVLDARLTKQRTRMEGRLLEKCLAKGIRVPRLWRVAPPLLYMEFLEGDTVRNVWQAWQLEVDESSKPDTAPPETLPPHVAAVGRQIGDTVGKLHTIGVIHGDLTTSNMILVAQSRDGEEGQSPPQCSTDDGELFLIDFGLSKNAASPEERAVDLFVLERALSSTHPNLPDTFMDDVIIPAYRQAAPQAEVTLQRLEQVRLRGRKRECFG